MNNILVTGANGQLGSELRKISPDVKTLAFQFTDIDSLDLTNDDALQRYFENHRFDCIINCAAYTAVDKAETEPEKAFLLNARVPQLLQQTALKYHSRLIHLSTDYVFDGNSCLPYKESHTPLPVSVYGHSKLAGEKEVLKSKDNIVIRTSWLYSLQGMNFMKTMLKLGRERESINVVYDQIGTPTSATDLAYAIVKISQTILDTEMPLGGIYHYSNEGVCSWYDFACEIMELAGLKCGIHAIPSDQYPSLVKRPPYSVLSKEKIKSTFGLNIPHWRKSLMSVLEKMQP
jgi:dTDP-4-dehydrorhamnose reductase